MCESEWAARVLRRHLGLPDVGDVVEVRPFSGQAGAGFASELLEATVRGVGRLVVKLLPEVPRGTYRNLDQQHLNERHFYERVLPLLASAAGEEGLLVTAELFPRFFCGHRDDFQALVAVEDLRPRGYAHADGSLLDEAHVKVALRELGRFHALSYVAKRKDLASFLEVVNGVQQPRTEEICREISPMIGDFLGFAAECFRSAFPGDVEMFSGKLDALGNLSDKLGELAEPEEPLAVICHGDFHRNNILFRYDTAGSPSSAAFVDFQLKMYSSPAVDISLLLFLGSAPDVWSIPWEDLLASYRSSVLDTMARVLGAPRQVLEEELTSQALLDDFGRHCAHGFLTAVFFLPVAMLDPDHYALVRAEVPGDLTAPGNSQRFASLVRRYCGGQVRNSIATMLKLMMERGFV